MRAFLERVAATLSAHEMLAREHLVLVAFSGGADSTALLHVLHTLGYRVAAAHVHHGLRGEEAEAEAAHAAAFAASLGAPFAVRHAEVRAAAEEQKLSLETAAREVRYRLLEEMRAELQCRPHCHRAHRGRPGRDGAPQPPPRGRAGGALRHPARAGGDHPAAACHHPRGSVGLLRGSGADVPHGYLQPGSALHAQPPPARYPARAGGDPAAGGRSAEPTRGDHARGERLARVAGGAGDGRDGDVGRGRGAGVTARTAGPAEGAPAAGAAKGCRRHAAPGDGHRVRAHRGAGGAGHARSYGRGDRVAGGLARDAGLRTRSSSRPLRSRPRSQASGRSPSRARWSFPNWGCDCARRSPAIRRWAAGRRRR